MASHQVLRSSNCELEIDLSDNELAEIMPQVPPRHSISPIIKNEHISLPDVNMAEIVEVAEIADMSEKMVSIPSSVDSVAKKPNKKSRTSRIGKTGNISDIVVQTDNGELAKIDNECKTLKSVVEPTKANKPNNNQQFTLELTKDCFTADELAINPLTHIFIENSRVNNDELIKYQAIRTGILDYKCYGKGCPTKDGNWRRKLGFLILTRNNNRNTDLRITNLSLLCPNCYCQEKGIIAFEKIKKDIIRTCTFCSTPLDTKYNSDKCGRCAWQIKNKIQKSANIDRLSRAFGTDVDGLSASNMAILMNSSILDETTAGNSTDSGFNTSNTHKYSGNSIVSGISRYIPRQNINTTSLNISNSKELKRLFMELSEQI